MEPRFGLGLSSHDMHNNRIVPRSGPHNLLTGYRRPWAVSRQIGHDPNEKSNHFGKDGFQACVDVHHFRPSEISVKVVSNAVVVEGNHEEREDGHGTIKRCFVRKYNLPKDYDTNRVNATLSSDGVLTLKAPPPVTAASEGRHIEVSHTNMPAHLDLKPNNGEHPSGPKSLAQISSEANGKAPSNHKSPK